MKLFSLHFADVIKSTFFFLFLPRAYISIREMAIAPSRDEKEKREARVCITTVARKITTSTRLSFFFFGSQKLDGMFPSLPSSFRKTIQKDEESFSLNILTDYPLYFYPSTVTIGEIERADH